MKIFSPQKVPKCDLFHILASFHSREILKSVSIGCTISMTNK